MPDWCEALFNIAIGAFVEFIHADDKVSIDVTCVPTSAEWHASMMIPIPETVKYAKAVTRITNTHPTLYTAVAYNDAQTLGIAFTVLSLLTVEREYTSHTSVEWREEFWLFLRTLNDMAAGSRSYTRPYVPTRVEIRANIDETRRVARLSIKSSESSESSESSVLSVLSELTSVRESRESSASSLTTGSHSVSKPGQLVSVAGAFDASLREFAEELRLPPRYTTGPDCIQLATWASMLTPSFEDACNDGDLRFLTSFGWPLFTEDVAVGVRLAFAKGVHARVFEQLNRMNGFARVARHVPANVMDEIEGYTTKLLADVKRGAVNIRNLDLNKIGSAVLSKVSAKDMSSLSANIDGLLPLLENASFKR
jgi:hypothetical protein